MQGRISNVGMCFVLVVLLSAMACSARPPRSDVPYGDAIQDSASLENNMAVAGDGHPGVGRLLANPDDTALAAMQLQLLQQYANYNNMRNYPWEQFLRAPQDKRQTRYRQCYFNPISCFRK